MSLQELTCPKYPARGVSHILQPQGRRGGGGGGALEPWGGNSEVCSIASYSYSSTFFSFFLAMKMGCGLPKGIPVSDHHTGITSRPLLNQGTNGSETYSANA